jgi:hypothetical protein
MKHKGKLTPASKYGLAPVVTQEQLAEYARLCEISRRKDALRDQIVGLLECGASVVPGPLTARVEVAERTSPSWPELRKILGHSGVKALRAQIQPTVVRKLRLAANVLYHPYWQ